MFIHLCFPSFIQNGGTIYGRSSFKKTNTLSPAVWCCSERLHCRCWLFKVTLPGRQSTGREQRDPHSPSALLLSCSGRGRLLVSSGHTQYSLYLPDLLSVFSIRLKPVWIGMTRSVFVPMLSRMRFQTDFPGTFPG